MTEREILEELRDQNEICFGIMIGEFGWELILWSGFIKKYKRDNPEKKIYVATRENRKELYNGFVDDIITFSIPNDYNRISPRTNTLMLKPDNVSHQPKEMDTSQIYGNITNEIQTKYPNAYIFSFEKCKFRTTPIFDLKTLIYDFNPAPSNAEIINTIISKNPGKEVITIFARNRVDMSHRNWSKENWKALYDLLHKENYLIFVSGIKPSVATPPKKYKNMYVLEDLEGMYNEECSTLGLTIESVKRSLCTFGPQTAGILLSNVLRVPNIYIGKESKLVSILHNPYNTVYKVINPHSNKDYSYIVDPHSVHRNIKMFVEDLIRYKQETGETDLTEESSGPSNKDFYMEPTNPELQGLAGVELEDKIKQINNNPNYKHNVITTIPKKIKIR